MENTILMLANTEIIKTDDGVERKVCTFEKRAESRFKKGVFRRVIGSPLTIVNMFPLKYNAFGDLEVPNPDYVQIDDFMNDEVPGLAVHRIATSDFNFPSDAAGTEPRSSVTVVTMNDGNPVRAALYQLRGTGASFVDENGVEHQATTATEQELKVKEGIARSAALKGGTVDTPKSGELSPLQVAEAAFKLAEEKLAKATTQKQREKAQAELEKAEELVDSLSID